MSAGPPRTPTTEACRSSEAAKDLEMPGDDVVHVLLENNQVRSRKRLMRDHQGRSGCKGRVEVRNWAIATELESLSEAPSIQ